MDTNQEELLERMMKGERPADLAKALSDEPKPATPPAPAASTPPVATPAAPAAPAQTPPPAPAAESDEVKALKKELEELKTRYGGLRTARDERVDKLTKELEAIKAKQAEDERKAKLAEIDAEKPEGFDEFAPLLEHAEKRKAVVAPPAPAKAAEPSDDDRDAAALKWWNDIADAVPEFPKMGTDREFLDYVGTRLASEGIGHKWASPTWVAANVSRLHADFQAAKGAAAKDTATQHQHQSGAGIPDGVPGPRPTSTPKTKAITLGELNEMMLDPKSEFAGKSLADCMRIFEQKGYVLA